MPTNVSYKYTQAEEKYYKSDTDKERLLALQEMLREAPTHKGCENLRSQLKQRMAKLKTQQQQDKQRRKGSGGLTIKREGACQIVFVGAPNSGKSTFLSRLSGTSVKVATYEFTTKKPEVRMIPFENIKLQGIEIPAIYPGFSQSSSAGQLTSLIKIADFIVLVVKEPKEIQIVKHELELSGIYLSSKKQRKEFDFYLPHKIVFWNRFDDKKLVQELWKEQRKIRVQTRTKGKVADKPIILESGAIVQDVAKKVHKDFIKKFKYAKIWGPSAKFQGQQFGLEHKLKDTDIVEIYVK